MLRYEKPVDALLPPVLMKPKTNRTENALRLFWFVLACGLVAGAIALFEARNADRDLVLSEKGKRILDETIQLYPDTKDAMESLMQCVRKNLLKIDQTADEDDLNRPRQVCPKYAASLEATHPSPIGMREMELAYRHLILGLKANL